LRASGKLVAEWLFPCLATLAIVISSGSPGVIRWSRGALLAVAIGLWLHGGYLLSHGYATRPLGLAPGSRVEPEWYTPFTGLRRVVR
jgi:hypothetical protein